MFYATDRSGRVRVAFTDASGEAGAPLNLALPGTAPAAVAGTDVEASRRQVLAAFVGPGTVYPAVGMRQVHGAEVALLAPEVGGSWVHDPPTADGLVCASPGPTLIVRTADCLPVVLADPDAGVVGVAHAGREGMLRGVVPATVDAMRAAGAHEPIAWFGPAICGRCYEVPEQMREDVARVIPEAAGETSWGTPALDIAAGVRAQLAPLGVEVRDLSGCTFEDERLWSHRRQGAAAGRLAGLVRIEP